MRVRVAASPLLLDELLRRVVADDGVDLTESSDCLVTLVTLDHVDEAHSRIVLVLGSSIDGDVDIIIDEQRSVPNPLRSEELRDLAIDMGHQASPPRPADVSCWTVVAGLATTRRRLTGGADGRQATTGQTMGARSVLIAWIGRPRQGKHESRATVLPRFVRQGPVLFVHQPTGDEQAEP